MPIAWRSYDVSELLDTHTFLRALERLPWPERQAQVMSFTFERDRCLCLGAGLLLARMLTEAGASDLTIGHNEFGKPHLTSCQGIHFNLSHSGTIASCAVADEPVGIDVERRHPCEGGVVAHAFTDDERRWLAIQPDTDWAFTRLWTRKESYLKLLGMGLSEAGLATCVSPEAACTGGVRFHERRMNDHAHCLCTRATDAAELGQAPAGFWR